MVELLLADNDTVGVTDIVELNEFVGEQVGVSVAEGVMDDE